MFRRLTTFFSRRKRRPPTVPVHAPWPDAVEDAIDIGDLRTLARAGFTLSEVAERLQLDDDDLRTFVLRYPDLMGELRLSSVQAWQGLGNRIRPVLKDRRIDGFTLGSTDTKGVNVDMALMHMLEYRCQRALFSWQPQKIKEDQR